MKHFTKYLNISAKLIKCLVKDNKTTLLDIIFKNLKFYENRNDITFELYKNLNISSNFIKRLIKDKNGHFLDIIFSHLKFYDNELILQLLFLYKSKTAMISSDLNQLISNEKFKNFNKYLPR